MISDCKVLVKMKVRSCRIAPLLYPLLSMPDEPGKGEVLLSKVVHHLHLLLLRALALPAHPVGVEDVEELSDVEVVVVGLQVAQQLCPACLAHSTGRAMRWTMVGGRWRGLRRQLLLRWRRSSWEFKVVQRIVRICGFIIISRGA